jgi:hypothetical protein
MSEPERPFLPMSGELGGDFVSGMADTIRERRAREVPEPEREEGVDEEKKIRSTIASLERTLFILMVAAIAATIGALSVGHWLLMLEFALTAAVAYAGAGYVLLLLFYQYQELRRLRR